MVESALIYTIELILFIILYFVNSPLQYIVLEALVPSIGIVFVLIPLRVNIANGRYLTRSGGAGSTAFTPPWPSQDVEEIETALPSKPLDLERA
ncbi:hypothetical protein MD484_g2357, partial [Candolleomyces efflorescens]